MVEPLDWIKTLTSGQVTSSRLTDLVELSFRLITNVVVITGLDLLSVAGGAGGMVHRMTYLSTVWLAFSLLAAAEPTPIAVK